MCLIIAPGKDGAPALLPRDAFDYAFSRNKDGFGAMWVEDGKVNHFKTLGLSVDEAYDQMQEHSERFPSSIFHLRMKTHGKIIPGLSHPFRLLTKKRHGKDLFFMHNGVLSSFGNKLTYGQSDTTVFKDKILIPLLTRDPDALEDPEIWSSINKLTSGSRLIFLDSEGKVYKTSENSWNDRYGLTLSNTYMLPYEATTTTYSKDKALDILTGGKMVVTGQLVYFRQIDRGGVISGHWCSCPKIGFIRTDSGMLYKDSGVNNKIYHTVDFIPKNEEFKYLGLTLVPSGVVTENLTDFSSDFEDDDIPPFDLSPSVDRSEVKLPAPEDQRLRYARLIHNTYAGKVSSRVHLLADLIGMNDTELNSLVDEDPETSSTIVAELIEMVIEYNTILWGIDPNHSKILNVDEILRIGQTDYHRDAMKEVAKIRRAEYEEQIKKINEVLDTPDNDDEVMVG